MAAKKAGRKTTAKKSSRKTTAKTTTRRTTRGAGDSSARSSRRDLPHFRAKINRPDGTEFGRVGNDPEPTYNDEAGAYLVSVLDADHHNHSAAVFVKPDEREDGAFVLADVTLGEEVPEDQNT